MSIEGTWYNELGSQLTISLSGAQITGSYVTAVGSASGPYGMVGLVDVTPSSGGQAVGFTVVWTNSSGSSHSVTTWSGQYQEGASGEEIATFWLLTSEQQAQDDWAATNVGQDTFTRTCPTQEQIRLARKRKPASHPKKSAK